jgi:hypothetical protein
MATIIWPVVSPDITPSEPSYTGAGFTNAFPIETVPAQTVNIPIYEDFTQRQLRATEPDSNEIVRRGRLSETIKDVFVWELRQFFNTKSIYNSNVIPIIDKYAADIPGADRDLDPLATVVRVVRQFADLTQKLPALIVSIGSIKNKKIAMSGKFIASSPAEPCLVSGTGAFVQNNTGATFAGAPPATSYMDNALPFPAVKDQYPTGAANIYLQDGDFVEISTVINGKQHTSKIVFTQRMLGASPQTPQMIAQIINLQALYCRAQVQFINGIPTIVLFAGGPGGSGPVMAIRRTNATPNFDAQINFPSAVAYGPSNDHPARNTYAISIDAEVGIFLLSEGENTRSEMTDMIMDFFTFIMDDRQFTFYGRSFFGNQQNEAYQIIIRDNDISTAGEQETARQDDPTRKLYVNRVNVPVTAFEYIDKYVGQVVKLDHDTTLPDMQ